MSDLNALNCTTCGASLPALAGHRSKALICSYCGSVMDRHDGYKVLAQYRDMPRPDGPFTLGDEGEVMGIRQTVVGIVGVESRIEGGMYYWTNYQLYSPTHGYSWMTWNDGHLTHSRKVRDGADHSTNIFHPKMPFSAMGRQFQMFERYTAVVNYIEGELTWVPKIGDKTGVVDGIDPPYGFAMADNGEELETEMQTYLDRDAVLKSFGISGEALPAAHGVHPIQPFEPGALHVSMAKAAKVFFPIAAVLALGLTIFGGGGVVAQETIRNPAQGGALTFEAGSGLMAINLETNLSNQWTWYDLALTHEESGEEIEFGNGLSYYSGFEGGESWTEGSQSATMRFKPTQPGTWTLSLTNPPLDTSDPTLTASDARQYAANSGVRVEVRQNVFVSRYFWILALVTGLIAGSMFLRKMMFEGKRWGGEDDDD